MNEPRIIVGTIGCYPFVRGYPLGPEFLERLRASPWPADARIREMNWGPVAVVQDMQAAPEPPERVVLVTAVDRGQSIGSVHCRRWLGGAMDVQEVQARMFEAVTGVIHIDNLLAIGEYFQVWPGQTITVEVQLPYAHVGDYILDELASNNGEPGVVGERALRLEMQQMVSRLVTLTRRAVLEGMQGLPDLEPLYAYDLTPVAEFCQNRVLAGPIIYKR